MTSPVFSLNDSDRVLPVVPMFHANAWGLPYTAFLAGASLVHARARICRRPGCITLMESERVTIAAGVPTIWMGMVPMLAGHDLSSLR